MSPSENMTAPGVAETHSLPDDAASGRLMERTTEERTVLRNEGDEVKREGHGGIGAANTTYEGGEPHSSGTRWRKGAAVTTHHWRERWLEHCVQNPSQRDNSG